VCVCVCVCVRVIQVVIFERATFLVISRATSVEHSDQHRFEKISNIIKQFKLCCRYVRVRVQCMLHLHLHMPFVGRVQQIRGPIPINGGTQFTIRRLYRITLFKYLRNGHHVGCTYQYVLSLSWSLSLSRVLVCVLRVLNLEFTWLQHRQLL
jgi:hypothetical protein